MQVDLKIDDLFFKTIYNDITHTTTIKPTKIRIWYPTVNLSDFSSVRATLNHFFFQINNHYYYVEEVVYVNDHKRLRLSYNNWVKTLNTWQTHTSPIIREFARNSENLKYIEQSYDDKDRFTSKKDLVNTINEIFKDWKSTLRNSFLSLKKGNILLHFHQVNHPYAFSKKLVEKDLKVIYNLLNFNFSDLEYITLNLNLNYTSQEHIYSLLLQEKLHFKKLHLELADNKDFARLKDFKQELFYISKTNKFIKENYNKLKQFDNIFTNQVTVNLIGLLSNTEEIYFDTNEINFTKYITLKQLLPTLEKIAQIMQI